MISDLQFSMQYLTKLINYYICKYVLCNFVFNLNDKDRRRCNCVDAENRKINEEMKANYIHIIKKL